MTSGIISLKRQHTEFKAGYGLLKQDLPGLLQHISLLHPMEKAYFNTLKYDRRKQSYLLGRVACKAAISKIAAQPPESVFVDSGIFQFPIAKYVRNANIQVSITHCDDIGIALAFPEDHPMGIDIETIDAAKTETLESQITPGEKALISGTALPVTAAYTMLWTIKESLSKVLKTGLMTDFKIFEINLLTPVGNHYESTFAYHGQYKAISYMPDNYVCTIVLPKNTQADPDEFRASLDRVTGASHTR